MVVAHTPTPRKSVISLDVFQLAQAQGFDTIAAHEFQPVCSRNLPRYCPREKSGRASHRLVLICIGGREHPEFLRPASARCSGGAGTEGIWPFRHATWADWHHVHRGLRPRGFTSGKIGGSWKPQEDALLGNRYLGRAYSLGRCSQELLYAAVLAPRCGCRGGDMRSSGHQLDWRSISCGAPFAASSIIHVRRPGGWSVEFLLQRPGCQSLWLAGGNRTCRNPRADSSAAGDDAERTRSRSF